MRRKAVPDTTYLPPFFGIRVEGLEAEIVVSISSARG